MVPVLNQCFDASCNFKTWLPKMKWNYFTTANFQISRRPKCVGVVVFEKYATLQREFEREGAPWPSIRLNLAGLRGYKLIKKPHPHNNCQLSISCLFPLFIHHCYYWWELYHLARLIIMIMIMDRNWRKIKLGPVWVHCFNW